MHGYRDNNSSCACNIYNVVPVIALLTLCYTILRIRGGGMCIVVHDWAHDALWCATERRRVLCSSQYVFFMSQGEGWEPGFKFQRGWEPGFRFQVSCAHPLCPSKIGVTSPQGGGGMTNGKVKTER